MKRFRCALFVLCALGASAACSVDREGRLTGAPGDAGVLDLAMRDAADAARDANTDTGLDAALDAEIDAAFDADLVDAEVDGGDVDAAIDVDGGESDAGPVDAGEMDAGEPDAGEMDAGEPDAGEMDAGEPDAGELDAGEADAGEPDAGPLCIPRCMGATLEDCSPAISVPCGVLGCLETAGVGACGQIRASHVPDPDLLFAGTAAVAVATASWTINTDNGEILDGTTVVRAAGLAGDASGILFRTAAQGGTAPELGIFAMGSLAVAASGRITGTGGRALVLLSAGAVTVDGAIDVGARVGAGGPGGRSGGTARNGAAGPGGGSGGDVSGTFGGLQSGGGGGGHAGVGGQGGDHTNFIGGRAAGGAGGAVIADGDAVLLYGGGGGGAGANADTGGPGGGGGGALQLTSAVSITVSATGIVRAPGDGGRGGRNGGGGGGAGGTVLLEAANVSVLGIVVANGGGGGGGDGDLFSGPGNGSRGADTTGRAGGGSGAAAGNGGQGGAGASLSGTDGGDSNGGGGGAGAGAGRLFFAALVGAASVAGTTSPTDAMARVTLVVTVY